MSFNTQPFICTMNRFESIAHTTTHDIQTLLRSFSFVRTSHWEDAIGKSKNNIWCGMGVWDRRKAFWIREICLYANINENEAFYLFLRITINGILMKSLEYQLSLASKKSKQLRHWCSSNSRMNYNLFFYYKNGKAAKLQIALFVIIV